MHHLSNLRSHLFRRAVFGGMASALLMVLTIPAASSIAVTFDGDLRATTTNSLSLGGQGEWESINNTIFSKPIFLGVGNIGIGTSDPNARLEVAGGLRLGTDALEAQPTCGSASRSMLWYRPRFAPSLSSSSAPDALELCAKNASDTYAWVVL